MAAYTLDVLYCHQRMILFLLFDRDFQDSIEYFLLESCTLMLDRISYKFLPVTESVSH